jgi:hypothetical protein
VIPLAIRTAAPVVLTVASPRRRDLSEGTLIEASVAARLLGIRLLTLDATVVLMPADLQAARSAADEPAAYASARRQGVPRTRSRPTGPRLAEAVRSIQEGAELRAVARHGAARRGAA